jgi:nitroimidazol reductase NimA-like FMN-containing flavoprotein (pyridoxamine 5'-phosphate oxidase superfamily)
MMVKFTSKDLAFINKYEVCRLATVGNNKPHIAPVCYMFINNHFYIATDYNTKKYRNIRNNNNVSLVIDVYKPNRAVLIEGEVDIIEEGEEFREVYGKFYKKFDWVRKTPWKEKEAPFIKIKPLKKISWGL